MAKDLVIQHHGQLRRKEGAAVAMQQLSLGQRVPLPPWFTPKVKLQWPEGSGACVSWTSPAPARPAIACKQERSWFLDRHFGVKRLIWVVLSFVKINLKEPLTGLHFWFFCGACLGFLKGYVCETITEELVVKEQQVLSSMWRGRPSRACPHVAVPQCCKKSQY